MQTDQAILQTAMEMEIVLPGVALALVNPRVHRVLTETDINRF